MRETAECASPSSVWGRRYASEEQCSERTRLACMGWAALPDTRLSAVAIDACADEIAAADCPQVTASFYSYESRLPVCLRGSGAREVGAACVSDAQCRSSACNATEERGRCATSPSEIVVFGYEGDVCEEDYDCHQFLACVEGVCSFKACAEPGCGDQSAACGGFGNPPNCPLGTECSNANDFGLGQCKPYALDGETCDVYAGPPCLYPARCADETCQLPEKLSCP